MMCGGDEDHVAGVSSLTNEEPLVVMKACVDIVWEVVREDGGNGRGGMVWKGKASLCRGGRGGILKGAFGAENRDVSRGWSRGSHQGSEVFSTRRGDKDVIGVDGNVLVKQGEEEGVEDLLSNARGCRRHG